MHEVGIAQGLMKIIEDTARKHGSSHVSEVRVRIGKLSACVPESLDFAFGVVTEGTVAEGAKLNIEVVPARGRCDTCNIDFDVKELIFLCPQCQQITTHIVSGKELEIAEIEVE
jgi:hydrogenase nickel incorporation protein HypA/HybF